jgi:hypothetical protein
MKFFDKIKALNPTFIINAQVVDRPKCTKPFFCSVGQEVVPQSTKNIFRDLPSKYSKRGIKTKPPKIHFLKAL